MDMYLYVYTCGCLYTCSSVCVCVCVCVCELRTARQNPRVSVPLLGDLEPLSLRL